MQTQLDSDYLKTPAGQVAERILRSCVHCGFCNATCPTYQLLGDELDGPRGRIYQIKQVLEGSAAPTRTTQLHLDRCLTCRNCESTCPSGVAYGHLLDIGRARVEAEVPRPVGERLKRELLRRLLLSPKLFGTALGLGRIMRPVLPTALADKVSPRKARPIFAAKPQSRTMLMLEGCVQPSLAPEINAAAKKVLDRLGIQIVAGSRAGCCGAINQHMSAEDEALTDMKRNIDAWWPHIEEGAEAIIMTASGCGAVVKEYGFLLRNDSDYAEKAGRVSMLCRDLTEVLAEEDLAMFRLHEPRRIAFHPPCTLQHGQQVKGVAEKILSKLGYELLPVADSHLCCGSAGTYSVLQPGLSGRLKQNKLTNLQAEGPELIASANIGCQVHLENGADVPVIHWISLLEQTMGAEARAARLLAKRC